MRLLGLDISTKTGFSLLEPFGLIAHGVIQSKVVGNEESDDYPFNYLDMAKFTANKVKGLVEKFEPDAIIIEETNKGRNRYHQKQLEFLHFAIAEELRRFTEVKVKYISTSHWRKLIKLDMSKEDREYNALHKSKKNQFKDDFKEEVYALIGPEVKEELALIESKRELRKISRLYDLVIQSIVSEQVGKHRVKIEGKVSSAISKKDLSVDLVNRVFGTSFKGRDNDICDSVCLCLGYYELLGTNNRWRSTTHTK